jgi:predicted transposase/invertase (TIGR01784 family)
MKAKYINPFTDFGFKKIFGEEASKPLLLDFLNAILPEKDKISHLSFRSNEHLAQIYSERKAIFDIYCENESGEKFIVELQKAKQNYFKERTIYYSTFPIREQAEKGEWNYNLKAVYCIGILDFTFDDYETEPEKSEVLHTIKLKNQNGITFYDKLTFIYLEMPNFKKTENQLESRLDKWLYFIKYLEDFQSIPAIIADDVFNQAFEKAEIAKFEPKDLDSYEYSLKIFRDNKAVFEYVKETAYVEGISLGEAHGRIQGEIEGRIQGEIEGKIETAKSLKNIGIGIETIIIATGLSREEIENL